MGLFDPAMATYRAGSIVSGSSVLSGILQEHAYCRSCLEANREHEVPVFLVVWHSILAGVERSEEAAEARLQAVDRADLIGWIDEAQRNERDWRRRFLAHQDGFPGPDPQSRAEVAWRPASRESP